MPSLVPRTAYSTLAHGVYLNQAALGLIGQPAVEAMHAFLDTVARHGNLRMTDTEEVAYAGALRERVARLLHADASHIALVGGASELLGQLPLMLQPEAGSTILAVATDFPAVTRPWLRYAAQAGCCIHFVEDTPDHDLTDTLLDAINARTTVVAVSSVQYATGTRVDIPRLRAATARRGVPLMVDATQAAGALRVDARRWEAEVVVTSGYKWLGGHGGIARAAMAPGLLAHIPPLPGWMGAPDPFAFDATRLLLAEDARRYTDDVVRLDGGPHGSARCAGSPGRRPPRSTCADAGNAAHQRGRRLWLASFSPTRRSSGLAPPHRAGPFHAKSRDDGTGPSPRSHRV